MKLCGLEERPKMLDTYSFFNNGYVPDSTAKKQFPDSRYTVGSSRTWIGRKLYGEMYPAWKVIRREVYLTESFRENGGYRCLDTLDLRFPVTIRASQSNG